MVIIIRAKAEADGSLESLHDAYDRANDDIRREEIAADAYEHFGGKIRSMILRAAKGLKLSGDQLDALTWQALLRGLAESGLTRFKLSSAPHSDWQPTILSMVDTEKPGSRGPQARIWAMLSPEAKAAVRQNPKYIKSTVQNAIIAEINKLLRRRDLYDPQAWSNIRLPEETATLLEHGFNGLSASELSRLNALLIASAFPAIAVPPAPNKNLLGYISATVVPRMQPDIFETATGKKSDVHLADALAFLCPDIEAVRQMEERGTLPDEWMRLSLAERIYQHQKQRIAQRYGPVIAWWNARIRELQPGNPYAVSNAGSLQSARQLFEQNQDRVPGHLWKSVGAPYNLPTQALSLFGLRTIERLLATENLNRSAPSKAVQPQVAPVYTRQDSGDSDAERLLAGGHQSQAYHWLVGRLFSAPGFEAERSIGFFLARNPQPAGPEVAQFLRSLPPDIAEDIEQAGWNRTVHDIDSKILDAVRDPAMRAELMRAFQAQPQAVVASLLAIRRQVFCRTATYLRKRAG